jgi:hypothetical protein
MGKKLWLSCVIVWLGLAAPVAPYAQTKPLAWPAVTQTTKPWVRWWWLGNVVNERDLSAEMEKYAQAGLGGLEITPIYGVKGYEDRFINYLSPQWMKVFGHTLREAERLGLGIDMATGTGWPFGGPSVGDEDACKNFVARTWKLNGGERLKEAVTHTQKPLVRAIGKRVTITELKDPLSANLNLQELALDQVRFARPLPLQVLMAYDVAGKGLNLTKQVDAQGRLDWTAPPGAWTLVALFQGWHGKLVERAGPGGEGNVIDHFSATALHNYLGKFDQAFKGADLKHLRAFFNDSYEVDDAEGDADFTPRMFDEFARRRGYDLREHLPALLGLASANENARVLCDYRETISDLLLDEFSQPWRAWAAGKGKIIRNQSHGSPANILDLYAVSHIPETEGQEILRMKFASSAANVMGKRLVSAEAATWLNEHTLATLGDVKAAADKFFLGGINHLVYHGTAFSPENEAWPGFLFYAAVHFGPSNPFWQDFAALNQYVARVQAFLQTGEANSDVLLYYPLYDTWMAQGRERLPHFGGGIESDLGTTTGKQLLEAGFAYDLISDRQLQNVRVVNGRLLTGQQRYRAIVIPATKFMPERTWAKLLVLARAGAAVVVQGQLPADVPGWFQREQQRQRMVASHAQLRFASFSGGQKAVLGKGSVSMGADVKLLLSASGVKRETLVEQGLAYLRRRHASGLTYFIVNQGNESFNGWVRLQTAARDAAVFDAYRQVKGRAAKRAMADGVTEVYLQLAPGESRVLQTFAQPIRDELYPYVQLAGDVQVLSGTWQVNFINGGPSLPASVEMNALKSWTDLGRAGDDAFSGTARYVLRFAKPVEPATEWLLDLNHVMESARVSLNGRALATLIAAPFQVRVPGELLQAENTLAVEVTNLMTNRIIDLDKRGIAWKRFYNVNIAARRKENANAENVFTAAHWTPLPSGLLGPVTLTLLRPFNP